MVDNTNSYKIKTRPEVLVHPTIPKPLHGLSPRSIKGKDWWDVTRKQVYKEQGWCCIACGVKKEEAKYHQWLEAHESYKINYTKGFMVLEEIIALCHSCHNFIHCGRLQILYYKNEISFCKFRHIMLHGFKVLKDKGIKPHPNQVMVYLDILSKNNISIPNSLVSNAERIVRGYENPVFKKEYSEWFLEIEGKRYYSKFSCEEDWSTYFS